MRTSLFLLPLLLALSAGLYAHPHLYIDLTVQLDMNEEGLQGFREEWHILRTFGTSLVETYDTDKNGTFDALETAAVEREIFSNIEKYHFYTFVERGSGTFFPGAIENFRVDITGGQAVLSFYVPCQIPAHQKYGDFVLTIYDPSRYVSFGLMYIDDPSVPEIEYEIAIFRDSNVYSHSNMLGNSIIEIGMRQLEGGENSDLPGIPAPMVRLTEENAGPADTAANPFLTEGQKLNDGTGNPFMTN